MIAVGRVNFINAIVQHRSNEKIIKDRLCFRFMFGNKLCNGIEGLIFGGNALYSLLIFVEINKLFCF